MPLKLNVGASRKVGDDNYGSRGASVHMEVELDASLINYPDKLQERIRHLFGQVHTSLAEELGRSGNGHAPSNHAAKPTAPAEPLNGGAPKNGKQNGSQRLATPAQIKALYGISKRHGMNLHQVLRERCGLERPEDLSLKEASALIDSFKSSDA
jgi:hypothetical protein